MREVFEERDFDEQSVTCSKCGWRGTGSDTHVVDLYGVSSTKEAYCPNCDTYLCGVKREGRSRGESSDEISFQLG